MTAYELPLAKWHRLAGTDLAAAIPHLAGASGRVAVVEDQGVIIGTWAGMALYHAEGVWIHPDHRGKSAVARRLWLQMRQFAQDAGASAVLTGAATPDVAALLLKHGQKLPEMYLLPVGV